MRTTCKMTHSWVSDSRLNCGCSLWTDFHWDHLQKLSCMKSNKNCPSASKKTLMKMHSKMCLFLINSDCNTRVSHCCSTSKQHSNPCHMSSIINQPVHGTLRVPIKQQDHKRWHLTWWHHNMQLTKLMLSFDVTVAQCSEHTTVIGAAWLSKKQIWRLLSSTL